MVIYGMKRRMIEKQLQIVIGMLESRLSIIKKYYQQKFPIHHILSLISDSNTHGNLKAYFINILKIYVDGSQNINKHLIYTKDSFSKD
jgi:hypothetical protein